jgi:protein gp37
VGRKTGIEWTDATWNPIEGCSRVSEGCRNCYAERIAARFSGPGQPWEGLARMTRRRAQWTGQIRFVEKRLHAPSRWKKPQRIFVNSMSDLFHESISDGMIARIWTEMALNGRHTFQILTKRPKRMLDWVTRWTDLEGEPFEPQLVRGPEETRKAHPSGRGQLFAAMLEAMGDPPPGCAYPTFDWMEGQRWWPRTFHNIWLGVSIEDQRTADERIPQLLCTPAAVRFISYEPALGSVNLRHYLSPVYQVGRGDTVLVEGRLPGLDWVIAGGESGPKGRPSHPDWFLSIRDQCTAAGVPFFFKQWGEWAEQDADKPLQEIGSDIPDYESKSSTCDGFISRQGDFVTTMKHADPDTRYRGMVRIGKKRAGRLLDGREWNEFPSPQGQRREMPDAKRLRQLQRHIGKPLSWEGAPAYVDAILLGISTDGEMGFVGEKVQYQKRLRRRLVATDALHLKRESNGAK